LSDLDFVAAMIDRGWMHPYNEWGEKVEIDNLPRTITEMPDDPYQSIAAFLRIAGVFGSPSASMMDRSERH
jgi:hypothetical protein